MNPLTPCKTCGRPIPNDAPQGVCPACVFGLVGRGNRTTDADGMPVAEAPMMSDVIRAFPQLEILEPIGQGGMGAVYRVRQVSLDRIAALKLLNIRLANDPLFQERFAREAKLMAKLLHPNIATIFEFGQSGDFCFLLMEFIEGVNLREAIRAKSSSPEEALRIIPQICDALQYAHDQGVIHRDVKPENILLDKYGRVKLVDFGLAKLNASSPDQMSLTGTQQIMGTMNYMAPEQREHSRTVDHRADIYSLGVVFYELLTGELPLGKFAEPSLRAKSSQQLDPVVMRTLEKDPDARYQSASDVKTAVDSASHQGNQPVNRLGKWNIESRDNPALPFRVGNNVQHWQSFGMAQLTPSGLLLEYLRKHKWFGHDRGVGTIKLCFDEIASVRLKNGPLSRGMEIRTRSLVRGDDFPKSERGIFLQTKSDDDSARRKLFDSVCAAIGQDPDTRMSPHQTQVAQDRLTGPTFGLRITATLNFVLGAVGLAAFVCLLWYMFVGNTAHEFAPSQAEAAAGGHNQVISLREGGDDVVAIDSNQPSEREPVIRYPRRDFRSVLFNQYADSISVCAFLSVMALVVGLFQTYAWSHLRRTENYWMCQAAFISCVVPIHPAWIIGLPIGIWGMAAMGSESSYQLFENELDKLVAIPPKPGV